MLNVPSNAPPWAFAFGKNIDDEIRNNIWPWIARGPLTVVQLTADLAAMFPYGLAFVSDPPANQYVAVSNGTAFFYLDGTPV